MTEEIDDGKKPRTPRKVGFENKEGIPCKNCGSRLWFVVWVRQRGEHTIRQKECRHCHRRIKTVESASEQ